MFDFSTECGYIGTSLGRPKEDKAWNYIRIPPPMMQKILPKPVSENAFEFVFLKGYPTMAVSNSDDPPESFHSKDVFAPHKSIPRAWKYITRLDDRVTLVNGEKVLPLPIEGRIRQDALVKEAVVFGVGRSIPGLLLFRAESAKDLSDETFVGRVWPVIEVANQHTESFAQIIDVMVVPLPSGVFIPMTDKGSIIRAQIYKAFEQEIDRAYGRLDTQQNGNMKLDLPELERYLLDKAQDILGPKLSGFRDDFFSHGLNSLQAIQLRGTMLRDLDLGGNGSRLSQNAVFEQSNIANLAKHLHNMRFSKDFVTEKPAAAMKVLISKYSVAARPRPRGPDKNTIASESQRQREASKS